MLDLLGRASVLYCLVGLIATVVFKHGWSTSEDQVWATEVIGGPRLFLADLALFGGLATVLVALETRWRGARFATVPLALAAALMAVVNALWIGATGTQLTGGVVDIVLENPGENLAVGVDETSPVALVIGAALLIAPLIIGALRGRWARGLPPRSTRARWLGVAACAGVALIGAGGALLVVPSRSPAIRAMSRNVHLELAGEIWEEPEPGGGAAVAVPVVHLEDLPPTAELRNVLVFFIESGNYLRSSFGDPAADNTPVMRRLAQEGLRVDGMRAVVPHTTKAMHTALCGTYPNMANSLLELAENFPRRCLPGILGELGYRSAFFQSANGEFENRPRLVHELGFDEFYPRQLIDAEEITYINGDDLALVDPALAWIDRQRREGPFFVTLLTSLTHAGYDYPWRMTEPACDADKQVCRRRRYEALYAEADRIAGLLVEGLAERGVLDNTIVIVAGDHGEAFGEHGKYVHDSVYYDEGLKVPYVVRAPGLIRPGAEVAEARSLLDTFPTVLALLGVPYAARSIPGVSLLEPQPPRLKRYFSCWYHRNCIGYVSGARKLVYLPKEKMHVAFDLAADPGEQHPAADPPGVAEDVAELRAWINAHRGVIKRRVFTKQRLFGMWKCEDTRTGRCRFDYQARAEARLAEIEPAPDEGLSGRYYSARNFHGRTIERIDPLVDFHWGSRSPLKGLPGDRFSVRWEGCLDVRAGESPVLVAGGDDGIFVYVDGRPLIENGGTHGYEVRTAAGPLGPGLHPIVVEFEEWTGSARAFVGWSLGREHPRPIPSSRLVPLGGNARHECAALPLVRAHGIDGAYFRRRGAAGAAFTRRDRRVEFDWRKSGPGDGVPDDGFAVRWRGCLAVPAGRRPILKGWSNDRLRLKVDGEVVIAHDGPAGYRGTEAAAPLEPGVHTLEVDYVDGAEAPRVLLEWKLNALGFRPIPHTAYVPPGGNGEHACPE